MPKGQVMSADEFKFAGPIIIEPSVRSRDASIREDNDGERIDDSLVRGYVAQHREEIFKIQGSFFAELREKESRLKS